MFMPPGMILPLTILKSTFVPKAVTRIALCSLLHCTASASSETGSKHVENTWMFSACFLVDRCVGQSYLMSGLSSIQPLTTQKTSDVCSGFAGVWQACLRSWLLAVRFSPNEISTAHIQTNTAAQGQVTYTRCAKVDAPKSAPHSMHRFSPRMDLVGSPEPPSRANLRCKVHTQ